MKMIYNKEIYIQYLNNSRLGLEVKEYEDYLNDILVESVGLGYYMRYVIKVPESDYLKELSHIYESNVMDIIRISHEALVKPSNVLLRGIGDNYYKTRKMLAYNDEAFQDTLILFKRGEVAYMTILKIK